MPRLRRGWRRRAGHTGSCPRRRTGCGRGSAHVDVPRRRREALPEPLTWRRVSRVMATAKARKIQASEIVVDNRTLEGALRDLVAQSKENAVRSARLEQEAAERSARFEQALADAAARSARAEERSARAEE